MHVFIQLLLLAAGFALLIKGADWFVEGASKFAVRFGIPQLVIGLTIVAMGTSAPEAAVSVLAALRGSADITVGNVLGSNIINVMIILGLAAVLSTLEVKHSTVHYELPFVIAVSVLLPVLGLMDGRLGRIDGLVLWALMIVYLLYLRRIAKADPGGEGEEEILVRPKDTPLRLVVLLLVGVGLILWGSNIAVDAASELARTFGISERLIGLTIVALGTSLPELVTSVTAALRHNADIAVGNIVGSNIFNILFVCGTTSLITPVPYDMRFLADSLVAVFAVVLLLCCVVRNKKLGRIGGILLLVSYAAYFGYLILI